MTAPTESGDDSVPENTSGSDDTGRVLRVVNPTEPRSLNPIVAPAGGGTPWGTIFDRFVATDADGQTLKDGLVVDWERPQPNTWRFTLREGVSFQNGEPFNAEAMKFSIEAFRDTPTSHVVSNLADVTDVVVVDDLTVDVVTKNSNLMIPLVMTLMAPVPPEYYTEVGLDEFGLNPIGTGPFVFESWESGISIDVSANADYWRGAPSIAGINFTFVADPSTRVSLLQTDAADLIWDVPVQLREELRSGEGTTTIERDTSWTPTIFVQTNEGSQFEDPELREAVALAMDREALTEGVLNGEGGVPQASELLLYLFDPVDRPIPEPDLDAARAIVEAKGNPTITLSFAPNNFGGADLIGEAVAGMLESVGFTVERQTMDIGELTTAIVTPGGWDGLVLYRPSNSFMHPGAPTGYFFTQPSLINGCTTPEANELSERGLAAETEAESDAIYTQIEEFGVERDNCVIPLYRQVLSWGMRDDVVGFEPPFFALTNYYSVSFS